MHALFGIGFDKVNGNVNHALIPNAKPKVIRKSVECSWKCLKTEYIELHFQHRIDSTVPPETVAKVMKEKDFIGAY